MYTKPQFSFGNIQIAFASKSDNALKKMFLIFSVLNRNWLSKTGVFLATWSLRLRLPVKWLIKQTIYEHFCGGESIEDSSLTIKELNGYGIGAILDYSVEGKDDERSFDSTREEILRTIQR